MLVVDDPIEGPKDLDLLVFDLSHCFDNQLTVGELTKIAGEANAIEHFVALRLLELACPDPTIEGCFDTRARGDDGIGISLTEHDVGRDPGGHFGDAGAHQTGAHHTDACDLHG